jgi:transposase
MVRKKVAREMVVTRGAAVGGNGGIERQRFTKEFKLAALGLMRQGDKPAAQIAAELGIRRNQLYKWAEQLENKAGNTQAAFNGPGRKPIAQMSEVERLRRELARVTEERDILKKAAAYFAKEMP